MKSFIEAQFSSCPLVWMFYGRKLNRNINHIHEKLLRIAYKYYNKYLAIELFKVKENFSNTIIMSDIFPSGVLNYNLISQTFLEIPSILQNLV